MANLTRPEEIRQIRIQFSWFYALFLGICVLVIGIWIGSLIFSKEQDGYKMNLFTELLGIAATVFVIDRLRAYRDREDLKRRLVREVGSRSNEFAKKRDKLAASRRLAIR